MYPLCQLQCVQLVKGQWKVGVGFFLIWVNFEMDSNTKIQGLVIRVLKNMFISRVEVPWHVIMREVYWSSIGVVWDSGSSKRIDTQMNTLTWSSCLFSCLSTLLWKIALRWIESLQLQSEYVYGLFCGLPEYGHVEMGQLWVSWIWRFPEMGVPPKSPKSSMLIGFSWIFHYKPSILGTPIYGNPYIGYLWLAEYWRIIRISSFLSCSRSRHPTVYESENRLALGIIQVIRLIYYFSHL